jgi:hypothetical protein
MGCGAKMPTAITDVDELPLCSECVAVIKFHGADPVQAGSFFLQDFNPALIPEVS